MTKKIKLVFVIILLLVAGIFLWKNFENYRQNKNLPADSNLIASRTPDQGCKWVPFTNEKLGISMLVEKCFPQMYPYYSISGKAVLEHYVNDPATPDVPKKVIEVFTKPADQKIEEALKAQFIDVLPSPFSKTCVVVKTTDDTATKSQYKIEPNKTRMAEINKESGTDIPDYSECGTYALNPDSIEYFEYQPGNAKTKFIYVDAGQDEQYFDPDSIQLNGNILKTAQYQGTYGYEGKGENAGFNDVYVFAETDNTILFDFNESKGAPSYDQGNAYGRVQLLNGSGASVDASVASNDTPQPGCKLQFDFSNNSLSVTNLADPKSDGYYCGFGGTMFPGGKYPKISNDLPSDLGIYNDGYDFKTHSSANYFFTGEYTGLNGPVINFNASSE